MINIAHPEQGVAVGQLNTPASIAKQLGVELHRVEYIIASRGVEPAGWAGHCRIFSEQSVEFIAAELRKIDAERSSAEATAAASGRNRARLTNRGNNSKMTAAPD